MWKVIPGFEHYEVSDTGEVRSLDRDEAYQWRGAQYKRHYKGRLLKATLNHTNGYLYVHLGRGAIHPIHRLVAWAFLGEQVDGMVVRHIDGNKVNNAPKNLVYGTASENYDDAVRHGTMTVGESHYNAVLSVEKVLEIRRRCESGEKVSAVARDMGIKYHTALAVVNRKTWRHV